MRNMNKQSAEAERLLRLACNKVEQLVSQGQDRAAIKVMEEYPTLANDAESAIELIYAEFLSLEACRRLPDLPQWLDHYPPHRPRLERLLKLHDFMSAEASPSMDESRSQSSECYSGKQLVDQPFSNYQLLEEVGRGGMGIVFRAIQKNLGRTVAVKVLRSIENHPKVRHRFQQEAEAVASLQHPNIVQVIEISLLEGREFLSMEYLGGGSLESKLASDAWTNHEKANLVKTLASAAHYAHLQGIIHRDLKPANILFTADMIPKIVDFGLAKRLQDEIGKTQTGSLLGTPCYMSPEQASGAETPVGPASDIYSLGVILYQLLCHRMPFEGKNALETLRWITERDCQPPSQVISNVPRDLETICLKCLAKLPQHRYSTAKDLAVDLERFLDHLPIKARRIGLLERIGRKIRRHPQLTTLGASVVLAGVGGSGALFWQQQQVERLARENAQHEQSESILRQRANDAEGAYQTTLQKARESVKTWSQLGQRLDNEPGMDGLRRKAFEDAIAYYQEYLSRNRGDDAIRQEAAQAAIRAAHFHSDLAILDKSEDELHLADNWLDSLPRTRLVELQKIDIQLMLAYIHRRVDRWEQSQQEYEQAINSNEAILASDPNNTTYLIRQSNALVNLCVVYKYQKKWDESLRTYVRAIKLSTKAAFLRAAQPLPESLQQLQNRETDLQQELQIVLDDLNQMCDSLSNRNPVALIALAKENYLPEIALGLDDTGQVFEFRAQPDQAEICYREAIRMRQFAQKNDPQNRRLEQYLARSETNLGKLLVANDRIHEAAEYLNSAASIYSSLVKDFPERSDYSIEGSHCLWALAKCNTLQHEVNLAASNATKAVAQLEKVHKLQPKSLSIKDSLAGMIFFLSHCQDLGNNATQAKQDFDRAVELAIDRPSPCNNHAWLLAMDVQLSAADLEHALILSEKAVQLRPLSGNYWNTRALVLARALKWSDCSNAIERSIQLNQGGQASDWYIKSMALAGRGDLEEAKHWFQNAESVRMSRSPRDRELRRQAVLASELLRQDSEHQ